jgi:hypothetical protein
MATECGILACTVEYCFHPLPRLSAVDARSPMIENAAVDLLDSSSRVVHFTSALDPLWSGVVVVAAGAHAQI